MTRYLVFEPGAAQDGSVEDSALSSDQAVFVRDRWSLWAFLFPFVWPFWHGLWLAGLVAVALTIGFQFLGNIEGFGFAAGVLQLLLGLLVALEGPSLRARRYRRKGWRETAILQVEDRSEAELLYFGHDEWLEAGIVRSRRLDAVSMASPLSARIDARRESGAGFFART